MDGIVRLKKIGLLLADGKEGDFDLEVLKIEAVGREEGGGDGSGQMY